MKKLFQKLEILKVEKLINDKDIVLFTDGDMIQYIYNKKTNKKYYPRYTMEIER